MSRNLFSPGTDNALAGSGAIGNKTKEILQRHSDELAGSGSAGNTSSAVAETENAALKKQNSDLRNQLSKLSERISLLEKQEDRDAGDKVSSSSEVAAGGGVVGAARNDQPVSQPANQELLLKIKDLEAENSALRGRCQSLQGAFDESFAQVLEQAGSKDKSLQKRALAYKELLERREEEFKKLVEHYKFLVQQLSLEVKQLQYKLDIK
jgi:hypothetical protein